MGLECGFQEPLQVCRCGHAVSGLVLGPVRCTYAELPLADGDIPRLLGRVEGSIVQCIRGEKRGKGKEKGGGIGREGVNRDERRGSIQ